MAAHGQETSGAREITLLINNEYLVLPLLPNLQTRHEFPMMDINEAVVRRGPASAACFFWSDKDFDFKEFYLGDDADEISQWSGTFPNANRLYCYDGDEIVIPVMVEDMSGNQEILQVNFVDEYYVEKLKRPLQVRRARPLTKYVDCRFRSKTTFSESFNEGRLAEPFRGAIEIYCWLS